MQLLVDVLNSSWELHLIIADHDNLSAQGRMEKLNSIFFVTFSSAALRKCLSLHLLPYPFFAILFLEPYCYFQLSHVATFQKLHLVMV
jgi:hypothetical protein